MTDSALTTIHIAPSSKMNQSGTKATGKLSPANEGTDVADHEKFIIPAATADKWVGSRNEKKIGRFALVPIEELVYYANRQRRVYGLGPARE